MEHYQKEILWRQFGAGIAMLKESIALCPTAFWDTEKQFWYHAYHSLFFLDYYLTWPPDGFAPPEPFSLSEFEDRMPERTYSKDELLHYADFCSAKCKALIGGLNEANAKHDWVNESGSMRYHIMEILLYNLRHVQHHVGQLNLLLRQNIDDAPDWIYEAEEEL